jgi:hypothetical protein
MESVAQINGKQAKQNLNNNVKYPAQYWLIWILCGLLFAGIIITQKGINKTATLLTSAAENKLHLIVTRYNADTTKSYSQIITEQKNRQALAMRTGVSL